jgi:hypothetical protein
MNGEYYPKLPKPIRILNGNAIFSSVIKEPIFKDYVQAYYSWESQRERDH